MASRNQNKPPIPRGGAKGMDEVPLDKRRKIAVGRAAVVVGNVTRSRQVLSALNAPPPSDGTTDSDAGSTVGEVEFSALDDVKKYLKEMIPGKKTFFKGKAEKLEFMKKYRSCIDWLERNEDENLQEQERLHGLIEDAESKYTEMEAQLRSKEDELKSELEVLKGNHASLQESYRIEEADKLAITKSYNQEREARDNAEKARDALSEDLRKAQQEIQNYDQQIRSLQDINKRLQEYNTSLQQYNSRLQNDAISNNETITSLQKEKVTMMESLSNLRSQCNSLQEQLGSLRTSQEEILKEKEELKSTIEQLRGELQQVRDDRNFQLSQVQSLNVDLAKYKECTGETALKLERVTTEQCILESTSKSQREQIQMLQNQLDSANAKLQMADSTTLKTLSEYEQQRKLILDLQSRLTDAEIRIVDGEKLRKKLHNTILELKGNIRVFCRVRPLLPDRDCSGATEIPVVSYPTSTESLGRAIDLTHNGKKHTFIFDKVFDHGTSQEDVFVEISQLVQSALDGYKVCIFAYGQTGSGKTYTMMGSQEAPELIGLIPRSVEQIFESSQSLLSQGWKYKMQASMLEIYNETIRDLLASNRANTLDANVAVGKQYTIKHDQNGNTQVSDLTVVDVCSTREVSYLLQQAARSRSVSRTQMNEQSSRSHFVFMLRISGVNEGTEQHVQGVLNLIDLAGSERLDKSGSTGDRLKETQHINKSLLSLSDVILSIAKKEDHIPFRNSKLTYLLQPCLGGESKTLMFVNISPEPSSTGESKCSLQFASKVNQCEIGVPRRQTQAQIRIADSRLSYG